MCGTGRSPRVRRHRVAVLARHSNRTLARPRVLVRLAVHGHHVRAGRVPAGRRARRHPRDARQPLEPVQRAAGQERPAGHQDRLRAPGARAAAELLHLLLYAGTGGACHPAARQQGMERQREGPLGSPPPSAERGADSRRSRSSTPLASSSPSRCSWSAATTACSCWTAPPICRRRPRTPSTTAKTASRGGRRSCIASRGSRTGAGPRMRRRRRNSSRAEWEA